ncbi:MAG TPA: glycosyltransferase [Saprospiraceae bacterium]|nr:glycosyltransferase [Saprospiraceae bacterium]HNT21487.1 glycosyltransferase [Saprospiraceae bacterium]
MARLRILIGALNWGLGHATRCQPVIEECLRRGHEVHLAADGLAAMVFEKNNPDLPVHRLAPLNIKYSTWFWLKLLAQTKQLLTWFWKDRRETRRLQRLYQYDLILSDSRPACRVQGVPGILIINQPSPWIPGRLIRWFTHRTLWAIINRFDEICIPDLPRENNLSGKLIHLPGRIHRTFVGLLSRMQAPSSGASFQIPGRILAILSGPEPSRTNFETELILRLAGHDYRIAGGRPDLKTRTDRYLSYMDAVGLADEISKAEYIICRSGYSSLMDLAPFKKKLILVPTPGQTEQEYLAGRLQSKRQAVVWNMKSESLQEVLNSAGLSSPFYLENEPGLLGSAIRKWEEYCQKKSNLQG